jgi:hypothetical protein
MKTRLDRHAGVCRSALVGAALIFGSGNIAFADGTHETCLSGYELSLGKDLESGVTEGVTFAGIDNLPDQDGGADNAACDRWTENGHGGAWTAQIDRVGIAGIGSAGVSVIDGRWFWFDGDGRIHFGRVVGGSVSWPPSLDDDTFQCGAGVARFEITLSVLGDFSVGSFVGCLDDIHLDPTAQPFVFPQRIWGTLKLN